MAGTPTQPKRPAHRYAIDSGYPNGEETRQRIISTAIALFGQSGYKGSSTRDIAEAAGVKAPALQYYFGSKLGLYTACIESIAIAVAARHKPAIADLDAKLSTHASTREIIESYCRLQDSVIDSCFLESRGNADDRLLVWQEDIPEAVEARQLMRDQVGLNLARITSKVVGRLLGSSADDIETGLHAFALSGLYAVFYLDAARIYDALGWRGGNPGNAEQLKNLLRWHATQLLGSLSRRNHIKSPKS